jgi:SulP family sulfate permease
LTPFTPNLIGRFLFGMAASFETPLSRSGGQPRAVIVRMENVPLIDTTGVWILETFLHSAAPRARASSCLGRSPGRDLLRGWNVQKFAGAARLWLRPGRAGRANPILTARI